MVVFFGVRIPALGICEALPPACGLPCSIPFIDAMLVVLAIGATRFERAQRWIFTCSAVAGQATAAVPFTGAGEAAQ